MHRDWQPIEEVIGVVLNRLSRRLDDRLVTTHLDPDLPLVAFDDLLIQQVLMNLLENAIKFAPAGTPIDISASANDKQLVVEVADRGPGLPGEDSQRIFEKFYRAPASANRSGVGLGLAVCRGIVELHGGRIWAENRVGGGAVFRFTLPRQGSPPHCRRWSRQPRSHGSTLVNTPHEDDPQGAKVLLIEDEQEIRRFLRVTLATRRYQLIESTTGQAGLLAAAKQRPDVVILDLGLPDMDGLEVISKLREWSRVPIVVLSARGQEQDKVLALDAGADDYLTKPFGVDELLARMRVALRHASHGTGTEASVFEVDELRVDLGRRQVFVRGAETHLTPIEYRILAQLIQHAGKVVTHKQLLKDVWGPDSVYETNYLRVYMTQLRRKIEENPARPKYLLTEPAVGYRLRAE